MKDHRLVLSNLLRLVLMIAIVFFAAPQRAAQAATLTVPCDAAALISAIHTANTDSGADTLELAAGCTYTLTTYDNVHPDHNASGLPVIASDITINGNGAILQRSSAEGTPDFRFFLVDPVVTLRLNHLIMINGGTNDELHLTPSTNEQYPEADRVWGGAIQSFGNLIIQDSAFINNNSVYGGAILSWSHVTIDSSLLTGNRASNGGAISHQLSPDGAALTITNSTIAGNTAGTTEIDGTGSAIISFGPVALFNSTVAGNQSVIRNQGEAVYTIYNNVGLTLGNTIIANNTASGGATAYNCYRNVVEGVPYITDLGGNVQYGLNGQVQDHSCGANVLFADPLLGPLHDNGGPTQTMALLADSPAIGLGLQITDSEHPEYGCPDADQRGFVRPAPGPAGSNCDSGAFETGASVTGVLAFQPEHVQGLVTSTLSVTISGQFGGSFTGVHFTGSLPDGLSVAEPDHAASTCGGTVTAVPGSQAFSFSGGTLAGQTPCTISLDVVPPDTGEYTASTGPVSSKETGAGPQPASATLAVTDVLFYLPMVIRP